jgi:beta-glucosidase
MYDRKLELPAGQDDLILFGDANPSGKLPVTFLQRWTDSPACGNYPSKNLTVEYAEGIYVGLRVTPPKVAPRQPVEVSVSVRSTGLREGAEAVQLYVRDVQSSVDRPAR